MKTLRCAICGATINITRPAEPPVPGAVNVDDAERQHGWGSSGDGQILCRWHAPMARNVKLRDVVERLIMNGKL